MNVYKNVILVIHRNEKGFLQLKQNNPNSWCQPLIRQFSHEIFFISNASDSLPLCTRKVNAIHSFYYVNQTNILPFLISLFLFIYFFVRYMCVCVCVRQVIQSIINGSTIFNSITENWIQCIDVSLTITIFGEMNRLFDSI